MRSAAPRPPGPSLCAQVNSSLLSSDCRQRCSCSPSTGLTCEAVSCGSDRVCEVQAGARNCWAPQGLCSLSVDANLTTFDGSRGAFRSQGIYELSSRCPGLPDTIPWFRVVAVVQACQGKVGSVNQVHIFFEDGLVILSSENGVWVSLGMGAHLPWAFVVLLPCPYNPGCPSALRFLYPDLYSLVSGLVFVSVFPNLISLFWLSS